MPYVTPQDLEVALGPRYAAVTDRDRSGSADTRAVADALSAASNMADSYIGRFLPLPSVPPALRMAVVNLAIFELVGAKATETERDRRKHAVEWLQDIAAGRASLFAHDATGPDTTSTQTDILVDCRPPVFKRGFLP